MVAKAGQRSAIPVWIKLAIWALMIQGTGVRSVRKLYITAPKSGLPVSFRAGCGLPRQSFEGERLLIGDLVNEDTCKKWQKSEEYRAERDAYRAAFSDQLQANGAAAAEVALQIAPMMIRGMRPKLDKYGEQEIEGGKPVFDTVPAAVSAQMAGVVLSLWAKMQAAAAPPPEAPPAPARAPDALSESEVRAYLASRGLRYPGEAADGYDPGTAAPGNE